MKTTAWQACMMAVKNDTLAGSEMGRTASGNKEVERESV